LYFQAKDKHGISALLAAIWEGHTDCVKLLLEQVSPQTQQYSVLEPLLTAVLLDFDCTWYGSYKVGISIS